MEEPRRQDSRLEIHLDGVSGTGYASARRAIEYSRCYAESDCGDACGVSWRGLRGGCCEGRETDCRCFAALRPGHRTANSRDARDYWLVSLMRCFRFLYISSCSRFPPRKFI